MTLSRINRSSIAATNSGSELNGRGVPGLIPCDSFLCMRTTPDDHARPGMTRPTSGAMSSVQNPTFNQIIFSPCLASRLSKSSKGFIATSLLISLIQYNSVAERLSYVIRPPYNHFCIQSSNNTAQSMISEVSFEWKRAVHPGTGPQIRGRSCAGSGSGWCGRHGWRAGSSRRSPR